MEQEKKQCCKKCKGSGSFNHTVGSHSDDRGGDSDLPCNCTENDCFHLVTDKKPCDCHVSSPSWQTREREAYEEKFANPNSYDSSSNFRKELLGKLYQEFETYLIARISAVREEIAKEIEALSERMGCVGNFIINDAGEFKGWCCPRHFGQNDATQIARGSTK